MTRKCALFFTTLAPLWMMTAACQPASDKEENGEVDSDPEFLMSSAGKNGAPGYTPQGWGWKPGSSIEISVFNEPDSQGKPNPTWKKILDEKVEPSTMFGFSADAPFYPVRRTLCGNPAPRQFMLAMAKNMDTGKTRMRPLPVDLYFTFQPCPGTGAPGAASPQPPPPAQPPMQ
jgi:hypothetical protein